MLSSIDDNGLEFFIDDFDNCVNEIEISGNEYVENIPTSPNNNFISNYIDYTTQFSESRDNETYLSETTDAMTDSEPETCDFTIEDMLKIKGETNISLRDISNYNHISLRPRNSVSKKRTSPNKDIDKDVIKKRKQDNQSFTVPSEYYVGRLLWAKVKSHPWWPCMIFESPDDTFYKEINFKKLVHVAYFGPYVERGWVNVKDTMYYEGKSKFDDHLKQLQENKAPKHILQQYTVTSSKLKIFNDSWKDAEDAMMMSLQDRIYVHGISYKRMFGESSTCESEENSADTDSQTDSIKVPLKSKVLKKSKSTTINVHNFEFERIKLPAFTICKRSLICFLCTEESDDSKTVMNCTGCCGTQFHEDCMKLLFDYLTIHEPATRVIDYHKCVDCNKNVRRCFICQKLANTDKKNEMVKCSTSSCARYYHSNCLLDGVYQHMVTYTRNGSLVCPSHVCHACYIDDPVSVRPCNNHIRCLMCPAAFHRGEWCIPAGSREINSNYILCPQHLPMGGSSEIKIAPFIDCINKGVVNLNSVHFKTTSFNDVNNKDMWVIDRPLKACKSKPNNVTWCFICTKGGKLVCCEKCPASYHQNCVNIKELPEFFFCDECLLGKYPRYGEVLWLKIGSYRWWPGQIIHISNAPGIVLKASHGEGQFIVQFFGSNDHYWMNRTHVFPFEEGDDETFDMKKSNDDSDGSFDNETIGNNKLDRDYLNGLKIAAKVIEKRKEKWLSIIQHKSKPGQYRLIKTNVPIGNVRITKPSDLSQVPQCECRPGVGRNNADPCGRTSDCMNRGLMYECNPLVCRNGVNCRNQLFIRREYPSQEVFNTDDRGWALRTLDRIKKGDFVNEYVGELIDEAEAARRLKKAHDSNITNFYMMELDGQRIIDAGPAANLSRFMNHSCSPNVYTAKWTVNSDTRIGLFALRNIEPGEELTFNYHFFSLGQIKVQCKCGANNCSGFLGDPPKVSSSSDIVNMDKTEHIETKKVKTITKKKKIKKILPSEKPSLPNKTVKVIRNKTSPLLPNKCIDNECQRCGRSQYELACSYFNCSRVYHLECVDLVNKPKSLWLCPSHHCDICGRLSDQVCSHCTTSYCSLHRYEISHTLSNEFICSNHEDLFISQGSPTESQNGSTNATFSITGTDSLPSVSI